jgi:hypothetical protein
MEAGILRLEMKVSTSCRVDLQHRSKYALIALSRLPVVKVSLALVACMWLASRCGVFGDRRLWSAEFIVTGSDQITSG